MLRSTTHWMPLINGYSDYIPPEFQERAQSLRGFPSRDAFRALKASPPRYAVFPPRLVPGSSPVATAHAAVRQLPAPNPHDRLGGTV